MEDIFRILKTSCKVEKLRMQQAEALHKTITLYMITAWRIMLMTLLGRVSSDMEAEVTFTDAELHMMPGYARNYGLAEHTDLISAILMVATMDSYMNRNSDPPPSHAIESHYHVARLRPSSDAGNRL